MISKDTLSIWLDECKESGDPKTSLLISQLIETYDQLDSEKAAKSAVIKASAYGLKESSRKDEHINALVESIKMQDSRVNSAVDSFRKIYEISVYGNEIFKAEKLLQLWTIVERFTGSKTNDEMAKNSLEMMACLQELNDDKHLVDIRNNLVAFTNFVNTQNESNNTDNLETDELM